MEAQYFIEIFKRAGREKLLQSSEPRPIKFLEDSLRITHDSATLRTVAVWKICLKNKEQ